jgi:uncharacterized repeat protein (TIGR03803 family)
MRPSRFCVAMFALPALLLALANSSSAQTFVDIVDYTGGAFANPGYVKLAQGRNGDIYGTTVGAFGYIGSIFGITPAGRTVLLYESFNYDDGAYPLGGMTLATDGSFVGTTSASSSTPDSAGVIYTITPGGVYTALHQFMNQGDGAIPYAPPIQGTDGNYYGVTNGLYNAIPSAVYKYEPKSGAVTLLYQFDSSVGFGGEVGLHYALTQGIDGDLYGVANQGGTGLLGSIFRLTTSGTLRYMYNFPGGAGGEGPNGPLVQLSDGNFYGTASDGGTGAAGVAFKMTPSGKVSVFYNFPSGSATSGNPINGFAQGSDGNLYGASSTGGTYGVGTLYRITPAGEYALLHSFPITSGYPPITPGSLVQHTNGKFYGTSEYGGAFNYGMVYSLDVHLGPFVTFVLPTGAVGKTAQILGQGLTGTTTVTFNSVAATKFSVVSDTYMTAVVPSGATIGPVVVTTPAGTLTSNVSFRIIH